MSSRTLPRRLAALSLSALLAGSTVVGAGGGATVSASAPAARGAAKHLTIAFMRPAPDPYYQDGELGAKQAALLLNATIDSYYSNASQPTELANVQDAISRRVDGILMYSISFSAEKSEVAAANKAHIPIFLLYGYDKSLINKVAGFEQVNLIKYGMGVGDWLAGHVTSGNVAVITGRLGRGDAEAYQEGFHEGLTLRHSKLRIVASVSGDWLRQPAYNAAQDLITAHPDLKAMYVENEDMAIGAINALQRAGKLKQVTIVSSNGAPYGLVAIRAGQLAASNTCSPALEGVMAMRILTGVIRGTHQPGHLYYSITRFVTKANVGDAYPWVPTMSDTKRFMALPLLSPVLDSQLP